MIRLVTRRLAEAAAPFVGGERPVRLRVSDSSQDRSVAVPPGRDQGVSAVRAW
jgi:hypothetical protein